MFVYASFLVLGFSDFYLLGAGVNRPEAEAEADEVNEVDTVKVVHFSPYATPVGRCGGG